MIKINITARGMVDPPWENKFCTDEGYEGALSDSRSPDGSLKH